MILRRRYLETSHAQARMMRNMNACAYCHRTFQKREHLLRHQRSHTGEKPFACHKCGRRYARSDVLQRHVKFFHTQDDTSGRVDQVTTGANDDSQIGAGETVSMAASTVTGDTLNEQQPQVNISDGRWPGHGPLAVPQADPAVGQPREPVQMAAQALVGIQMQAHEQAEQNLSRIPPVMVQQQQQQQPLPMDHHQHAVDARLSFDFFDMLSSNANMLDFMDLTGTTAGQHDHAMTPAPSSADMRVNTIPRERFAIVARLWPNTKKPGAALRLAANIWADVAAHPGDTMWAHQPISHASPASTISDHGSGSRWGMDDERCQELYREYALDGGRAPAPGFPSARLLSLGLDIAFRQPQMLLSFIHQPTFSVKFAPDSVVFPLCLLGLVLLDSKGTREFTEAYLPVAIDKCCAQLAAAPPPGTGHTSGLIAKLTAATLLLAVWSVRRARAVTDYDTDPGELRARALYSQSMSLAQLSGLFQPHAGPPTSRETLDNQAMNVDQQWKAWARTESLKRLITMLIIMDTWWAHGQESLPLVRASGQSISLEMPCSGELYNCSSARAWRRMVDAGKAATTDPVVFQAYPSVVQFPPEISSLDHSPLGMVGMLCVVWSKMLDKRAMIPPPTASPLLPSSPSNNNQSNNSSNSSRVQALVPWLIYSTEPSGRALGTMLRDIYARNAAFLKYRNPNCVTLWHLLHLQLLASMDVFELAAGRDGGAERAGQALRDITDWSRTRHARRACLHAAGVYAAMSRRRVSDGTMMHSEPALFGAALVLGLYVFMVPQQQQDDGQWRGGDHQQQQQEPADEGSDEPYELLDEVDWTRLGMDGMDTSSSPHAFGHVDDHGTSAGGGGGGGNADGGHDDSGDSSAASRWLRSGGAVSFSGTICEGGYNAARMVLHEFASLLEEVGKWNSQGYCHVLRVMSESLLDFDDSVS